MSPFTVSELPTSIKKYLGEIKRITYPKQGCTSDVGIIDVNGRTFALKRSKGEQYCSWLSQEVAVLKSLSQQLLPVPNIHFVQEQKEDLQTWVLMEYIRGVTLGEALQTMRQKVKKEDLIYQFGSMLQTIHATPCPHELIKETPWIDEILKQSQYNLDHYEVDGSEGLLNYLKENKPKSYKQTLIHGDYTIDNVLVDDGKIVGIIDWSGGAFGDPRYDVSLATRAKSGAIESETDRKLFFEGYGEQIIDKQEYNYFAEGIYEFF